MNELFEEIKYILENCCGYGYDAYYLSNLKKSMDNKDYEKFYDELGCRYRDDETDGILHELIKIEDALEAVNEMYFIKSIIEDDDNGDTAIDTMLKRINKLKRKIVEWQERYKRQMKETIVEVIIPEKIIPAMKASRRVKEINSEGLD